ncbi:MAG: TonB-dependent receptor [Bryobacteraceae bacterium]|nr:TonB-dependent receptor [Bryobacteraceae bacterium]
MVLLFTILGIAVEGRVTDARTAEALAGAEVRAGERVVVTGRDGRFQIEAAPGSLLKATLVGYRPLSVVVAAEAKTVDFALHSDTLRQSDSVTVAAGPFDAAPAGGFDLAGTELRNLGSVLADDPFRAVQSMPGVGAYSDFQSQFTVRGANYERMGIYLDGVLLHQPFHAVQGDNTSASLALLQGELLESAALEAGPLAPRYADRTAGAVDFRLREGDQTKRHFRANLSASNAAFTAEGPLGKRVNWVAGVRKSYVQYIISRTADEPGIAFAFWDAQGKMTATLSPRQQLSLTLMRGQSGLDRSANLANLGLNGLRDSSYHSALAIATWRWTPSPRFLATQRFAWLSEDFRNENRDRRPLAESRYGERVWNGDLSASWSPRFVTEGGWSWRRVQDAGALNQFLATALRPLERYAGHAGRAGGYVQQTWSPGRGVELRAGGRLDAHSLAPGILPAPFAAISMPLPGRVRLALSWGQNTQFAELRQFLSPIRTPWPAERSQHLQAVLERLLGERSRLRFELFERRDRDLLFRPRFDPRLNTAGNVVTPLNPAPWESSLRGRARGWQAMWQRRSANGVTGWVAYTYTHTQMDERFTGARFISDSDLRHQAQAFLSYRWRPTINLSGRFSYATGLPIPGFLQQRGQQYFLAAQRNLFRLPDYQRTDLRLNKAFVRKRYQATLFAEVVNVTNRRNLRVDETQSFDARTRRVFVRLERTFPILPSAGVVFDF